MLMLYGEILTTTCRTTIYPLPPHKGIAKNVQNHTADNRSRVPGYSQSLLILHGESSSTLLIPLHVQILCFSFALLRWQGRLFREFGVILQNLPLEEKLLHSFQQET